MVHKGDRLFAIDPRTYQAKVDQLAANLARDKAQLASAKADLQRYTKLSKTGYSSQQKLEQSRAAAEALEAAVKADEAMIEGAKLDLAFTAILSPINGRTGSILIDAGNLVKANDTNPMVVINQTEPIYVTFAVPEHYLPEIKDRMAAGALKAQAIVPGTNVAPETGPVVFVNNAVDATTGTITLKAEFANTSEKLTPGQFVHVNVILHELPNALVVPSQAVQNGQNGSFIYVVQPNRTVKAQTVAVGPSYDGGTVIEKGLAAGDTVVTEGQLRLRPGIRITIQGDEGTGGDTAVRKIAKKKDEPAS
jgi:multidrug efflux system membrane fusion protein